MKKLLTLFAAISMLFVVSCGDDEINDSPNNYDKLEIIVDKEIISYPYEGGAQEIHVSSNCEYEVSTSSDWLSYEKTKNGLIIIVQLSELEEKRIGYVEIFNDDYHLSKKIQVEQEQFKPILNIDSPLALNFDYQITERIISVKSNFKYEVNSNAEWCAVEITKHGVLVKIAPNYIMQERHTTIVISGAKYNIPNIEIAIHQGMMPSDYTIIEYTTDYGGTITPYNLKAFSANIISNTYENGKGVMKFDAPLKYVGYKAFYNSLLSSIKLPASVTSIDQEAFMNCKMLECVILPDELIEIGQSAFAYCQNLRQITIPKNLNRIRGGAFKDCVELIRVDISDLSAWCNIIHDYGQYSSNPLHNGAELYLNNNRVTELVIPSDVTEVKDAVFAGCKSLINVIIPEYITAIGDNAFYNCDNLFNVTIGENVTSIGSGAFMSCGDMENVNIPDNVQSIYNDAFRYCNNLTDVTIGAGVNSISYGTFYDCDKLTRVFCKPTIPPHIAYEEGYDGKYPSIPFNRNMRIYVLRNAYNSYMQYSYCYESLSRKNWYRYKQYILPHDFE